MPNCSAIRTARLTDRQILDLIFVLRDEEVVSRAMIQLGGNISIDVTTMQRTDDDIVELDSNRHAIQSVEITTPQQILILFFRGICGDVENPTTRRQASPYFDELILNLRNVASSPESRKQLISCMNIIERTLPKTIPFDEFDKGQSAIDVLQAEIANLADQYKTMLDGLAEERAEARKAAEKERQAARQEHEEAMQAAKNTAIEQGRKFDEYRKGEQKKLQKRKKDLDEREQELDNRQHMHARRELRERISENFKTRIREAVVSGSASKMRSYVLFLTLAVGLGIGVMGFIDFRELVEINRTESFPGWLAAGWAFRGVIALGLSVGFIAYAINWLRIIYLDDVRTRRQYERYGHDIDRASFVIETIMEVGEKEKMQVPDAWVDGVCRNLFRNNADDTSGNSPANIMAMLFESISGAKIGPEGTEVSMSRRDARRMAKKMSGD